MTIARFPLTTADNALPGFETANAKWIDNTHGRRWDQRLQRFHSPSKAILFYKRTMTIFEKVLGADHPSVGTLLAQLLPASHPSVWALFVVVGVVVGDEPTLAANVHSVVANLTSVVGSTNWLHDRFWH